MERLFFVILLMMFCTVSTRASSQSLSNDKDAARQIETLLKERDAQIKKLLGPEGTEHSENQVNELKNIINGIIDFSAMAKHALQTTYQELTDEQKTEFVDLFATIIRDQSLNKLDIYRATVVYDEVVSDGKTAKVVTTATLDNVRTPVSYDLMLHNGTWYITDMAIDNVSTAESYRRSFQSVIRKRGFDALLESLRKRAG